MKNATTKINLVINDMDHSVTIYENENVILVLQDADISFDTLLDEAQMFVYRHARRLGKAVIITEKWIR